MPRTKHPTKTPLKLHHHKHTGKLLHHKHTSFRAVFLLLGVLGVFLASFQYAVVKADDLEVTAKVPALPVTNPAIFTSPTNGFVSETQEIILKGNCQLLATPTIVAVYRDSDLVGSTTCQSDSRFSLTIMLRLGSNQLTAKSYNVTNDAGPDSLPLNIIYRPAEAIEPDSPIESGEPILTESPPEEPSSVIINSRDTFLVFGPSKPAEWVGMVTGGNPPYSLEIDWGDESEHQQVRGVRSEKQTVSHDYNEMQTYFITITAHDDNGQEAVYRLAAVTPAEQTAGSPAEAAGTAGGAAGGGTDTSGPSTTTLIKIYTAYSAAVVVGAAAWYNANAATQVGAHMLAQHHGGPNKFKLPKIFK